MLTPCKEYCNKLHLGLCHEICGALFVLDPVMSHLLDISTFTRYAALKPLDVCLSTSVASQFLPAGGLVMYSFSFM
jgi:hypothetical protein